MQNIESEIQEIIDKETAAWNTKSVNLLLSIFHHDMVWVWPTDPKNIDPMSWSSMLGKFDFDRWSTIYNNWFANFSPVKNIRKTQKVLVTKEGDGAFAVVDIDTLWVSHSNEQSHWYGRTGKTYVKTTSGWKMINQVGVFDHTLMNLVK